MTTTCCRILIIEDHITQAELLAEMLENEFPSVLIKKAVTAEEALTVARAFQPTIIISDGKLPGDRNGSDTIRILRSQVTSFKALLVSGSHFEADGIDPTVFDARLDKPVGIDEFLSIVGAWL